MPSLKTEDAQAAHRPNHVPPGQFVSGEHEADCLRFLEQVKEFVRRRHEAGLARAR